MGTIPRFRHAETAVSAFSISVPYRNANFAVSAFLSQNVTHFRRFLNFGAPVSKNYSLRPTLFTSCCRSHMRRLSGAYFSQFLPTYWQVIINICMSLWVCSHWLNFKQSGLQIQPLRRAQCWLVLLIKSGGRILERRRSLSLCFELVLIRYF